MAKLYWVGSIDPVWHAGLQRFVARGSAVDADLVDESDERWHKTKPKGVHAFATDDAAPGEEQPTAADAAPQEVKTDG